MPTAEETDSATAGISFAILASSVELSQRRPSMCDYSLHNIASRPARVGDKLTTTTFRHTCTRGFAAVGEPDVAVCLSPGTEIAFEDNVRCDGRFWPFHASCTMTWRGSVKSIWTNRTTTTMRSSFLTGRLCWSRNSLPISVQWFCSFRRPPLSPSRPARHWKKKLACPALNDQAQMFVLCKQSRRPHRFQSLRTECR